MKDLIIHDQVIIPATELEVFYSRSSGPGGQNVNKVNSKVTVRWLLQNSTVLDAVIAERLRKLAGSRLNDDGSIQVTSQEHRDQGANQRTCFMKLQRMVVQAMQPPKLRKPTRPSAGSVRRRLQEKAKRSQLKSHRGSQRGSTDWS